jgi:four helix bundle protein
MTEARAEMPIFAKTYDFLAWLVPLTNHFPRAQRHTVTQRLLDAAMDYLERLVEANAVRGQARLKLLEAADAEMDKVRLYLRLAHHWRWITPTQYEHAGRLIAELGRLLGGWQKVTRQQSASGAASVPETPSVVGAG